MYWLIYSIPSPLHPHVFCPFPAITICLVTFEVALIGEKNVQSTFWFVFGVYINESFMC